MEELGSLLLLNDSAITNLPNKVGEFCSTESDAESFTKLQFECCVLFSAMVCQNVFPSFVSFSRG